MLESLFERQPCNVRLPIIQYRKLGRNLIIGRLICIKCGLGPDLPDIARCILRYSHRGEPFAQRKEAMREWKYGYAQDPLPRELMYETLVDTLRLTYSPQHNVRCHAKANRSHMPCPQKSTLMPHKKEQTLVVTHPLFLHLFHASCFTSIIHNIPQVHYVVAN
jgi:hypothetical protein